mmetsp:Transcript_3989/g.4960  ORF Transcript_3989/g.4960 Transcript_3989/m.4960 type:complete len:202 (-) Transcript_3989:142-747(-)
MACDIKYAAQDVVTYIGEETRFSGKTLASGAAGIVLETQQDGSDVIRVRFDGLGTRKCDLKDISPAPNDVVQQRADREAEQAAEQAAAAAQRSAEKEAKRLEDEANRLALSGGLHLCELEVNSYADGFIIRHAPSSTELRLKNEYGYGAEIYKSAKVVEEDGVTSVQFTREDKTDNHGGSEVINGKRGLRLSTDGTKLEWS